MIPAQPIYTGDDVTVVIPSVDDPNRTLLRMEAIASVGMQSVKPKARLVSNEIVEGAWSSKHLAWNRDQLIEKVETIWFATLDDDDLFYRNHIETLLEGANQHLTFAKIIYTWGDGRGASVHIPFDEHVIRERNIFCSTIMCKKSAWEAVGGYQGGDRSCPYEDWAFNLRVLDRFGPDAFVCIPKVTWLYRWIPNVKSITGAWRG